MPVHSLVDRRSWYRPDGLVLNLVLVAALLVIGARYLHSASVHDQIDFGVYRAGGHAIWTGHDLYALHVPPVGLPFTYPPASALLFVLLALAPVHAGQIAWMAASLLGLGLFVAMTMRRYASGIAATSSSIGLVVLAIVALSDPVRVNLDFGQINVLIGVLVVADLSVVWPSLPRGVMVGVAAALKLTPLFLVAYFIVVRRYRAAVTAACTFAIVTGLAAVAAPHASVDYWLHGYFADARRTGGIAYISNQSLNGMIVRLAGSPDKAHAIWLPIAILVGGAILLAVRSLHEQRPWLAEAIALAAMLLLSPVSWVHHWILVLPFLVACFRLCKEEPAGGGPSCARRARSAPPSGSASSGTFPTHTITSTTRTSGNLSSVTVTSCFSLRHSAPRSSRHGRSTGAVPHEMVSPHSRRRTPARHHSGGLVRPRVDAAPRRCLPLHGERARNARRRHRGPVQVARSRRASS